MKDEPAKKKPVPLLPLQGQIRLRFSKSCSTRAPQAFRRAHPSVPLLRFRLASGPESRRCGPGVATADGLNLLVPESTTPSLPRCDPGWRPPKKYLSRVTEKFSQIGY